MNRYGRDGTAFRRLLLAMGRTGRPHAGMLLLRLGVGLGLAWHGYRTLSGSVDGEPAMRAFIDGPVAGTLGLPFPDFFGYLAKGGELVGGLLVAVGLLTRPALLLLTAVMAVAAFGVHAGAPLGERELALWYLLGCVVVLWTGPGRFSLDGLLAGPRRRWR